MKSIHLLTKNNHSTIQATLESILPIGAHVFIGDLGSSDKTHEICLKTCKGTDMDFYPLNENDRSIARNKLIKIANSDSNFWIEPWEILVQGQDSLAKFNKKSGYVSILQSKILSHDIRLWDGSIKFVNPIFERLNIKEAEDTPILISSNGGTNYEDSIKSVLKWRIDQPFSPKPYYYHASLLLSRGEYDEFLSVADHYMFVEKTSSMSLIMTRYYYAMVQIIHKKNYKPALQNINLCLCEKPLMAEFWCLMADVYYHLLHKFKGAKEFYENAMILGAKRLKTDKWPMDISKYRSYPQQMIQSCDAILNDKTMYIPT